MEQYLPIVGAIGTGVLTILLKLFKNFMEKLLANLETKIEGIAGTLEANNKATFVMLQDRILQLCRYHQAHGSIPSHDAEMLTSLADQYYAMGGNGYVKLQVEATLALPQELIGVKDE